MERTVCPCPSPPTPLVRKLTSSSSSSSPPPPPPLLALSRACLQVTHFTVFPLHQSDRRWWPSFNSSSSLSLLIYIASSNSSTSVLFLIEAIEVLHARAPSRSLTPGAATGCFSNILRPCLERKRNSLHIDICVARHSNGSCLHAIGSASSSPRMFSCEAAASGASLCHRVVVVPCGRSCCCDRCRSFASRFSRCWRRLRAQLRQHSVCCSTVFHAMNQSSAHATNVTRTATESDSAVLISILNIFSMTELSAEKVAAFYQ